MAQHQPVEGGEDVIGPKELIKRVEFIRIIADTLYSLGYQASSLLLQDESGVVLMDPLARQFLRDVNDGKWEDSIATLRNFAIDDSIIKSASILILEQKFFECMDEGKIMDALNVLRTEIVPLSIDHKRACELSSCILSTGQNIAWAKSRENLLTELIAMITPTVIVPHRKLVDLVEQALISQLKTCKLHNPADKGISSLYTDHQCGLDQIPSQTLQILQAHSDEVWFLKFSHNGKYLASSSKDRLAIIWEVEEGEVTLKHKLAGHQSPVSSVSWSLDDSQILTCGAKEGVRRWDVNSGLCLCVYEKTGLGLVSCGWSPDGKQIFTGVTNKRISVWELDGNELQRIKLPGKNSNLKELLGSGLKIGKVVGARVSEMELTSDGELIITLWGKSVILVYYRETKNVRGIKERRVITSFSISGNGRFLLVNFANQEICVWQIQGVSQVIAEYRGHKRSRFSIRSCFGGVDDVFVASGSEDSQVYIWHRSSAELLQKLPGHSAAVNCVSWNPTNPHMFASASDDGTVRIWGTNDLKMKKNTATAAEEH